MKSDQSNTTDDALYMVALRNNFYRHKTHLLLGIFGASVIIIIALASLLLYLVWHPNQLIYFAADNKARLMPTVSIQDPIMPDEAVAVWVKDAVESAYSYNFMNYRHQLQDAQKYFTEPGWRDYMKSLTLSNNLIALSQRKMVIIAHVAGTPKLVKKGPLGKSRALAWKYEMPVLVTYLLPPYDDKAKFSNPLTVSVVLRREDILQSYQGLGIVQIIAKLAVSSAPQSLSSLPQ